MISYRQNDFAGAIEQLETLSEMEPSSEAEVNFYLGVSLLLVGRSQDAHYSSKAVREIHRWGASQDKSLLPGARISKKEESTRAGDCRARCSH